MTNEVRITLCVVGPLALLGWIFTPTTGLKTVKHSATQRVFLSTPPPSFQVKLSAEDLAFGETQVEQMMWDRSEMKQYVEKDDGFYQWVVRQFAGEAAGQRIYWGKDDPMIGSGLSVCRVPSKGRLGRISVREFYISKNPKERKLSCERLWSAVVFECFNISNHPAAAKNKAAAMTGKVSKEEWIDNITRIEFRAVRKTQNFFYIAWAPYLKSKGIKPAPWMWFVGQPVEFEAWIAQFNDKSGYPNQYNSIYDGIIAPYLEKSN